jgi:hypothetical protein
MSIFLIGFIVGLTSGSFIISVIAGFTGNILTDWVKKKFSKKDGVHVFTSKTNFSHVSDQPFSYTSDGLTITKV